MNRDKDKDMNAMAVPEQCFVTIKYGDDQEALLNPCCTTHTFVEWIRRICNCDSDIVIDLVDLDGQIRNLPATSEEYASDYLNGRETYIVIRVEREEENGPNRYISMLNNLDEINPELLVKLNNMSRPGTRGHKRDKGKKTPRHHKTSRVELKRPSSSERNRARQGK